MTQIHGQDGPVMMPETGLTIRCQHRDCKWTAVTMTFGGKHETEVDVEPVVRAYRDLAAQYAAHERERHATRPTTDCPEWPRCGCGGQPCKRRQNPAGSTLSLSKGAAREGASPSAKGVRVRLLEVANGREVVGEYVDEGIVGADWVGLWRIEGHEFKTVIPLSVTNKAMDSAQARTTLELADLRKRGLEWIDFAS